MTGIRRSTLDWARDIARAYRGALLAVDPERCARLDEKARENGQSWAAPTLVDPAEMERYFDVPLPPAEIERLWGVKAATIRSWARKDRRDPRDRSKPLLRRHGTGGHARYVPREVLAVQSRHRVIDGRPRLDVARDTEG
ncbi:hypothetical protein IU448_15155 [Nocardia flavorosea]|uniref:terminase gpP N-terminus-related DNA-binding protein n=1 Tax=Nocardia flavorosea TaxID=53429 RepID=UPI001892FE94|nr:hypothetical protein [Nocardia flavorosea]MBF6350344.1 hypothetical protein [Nocardia flavorosea]